VKCNAWYGEFKSFHFLVLLSPCYISFTDIYILILLLLHSTMSVFEEKLGQGGNGIEGGTSFVPISRISGF